MAQIDIRKNNTHNFLFNVSGQTIDPYNPYLSINNDGLVGIGIQPQGTSTVSIKGASQTKLDLYTVSSAQPEIRFISVSSSTPRHKITDVSGDLVIDPGLASGGGNDLVNIDGSVTINRGSSDVHLNLKENNSNPNFNAQLRWVGNTGDTRHIITEDASGNLLVDAGFGGGASNKLRVAGSAEIIDNVEIGGTVQIGATAPTGTYSGYKLGVCWAYCLNIYVMLLLSRSPRPQVFETFRYHNITP